MALDTWEKLREQAELQLWAREHGRDRFVLLQPQPESGLLAPPGSLARRPLLRLRGQPVLGPRRRASSTSGGSSTSTANFTPLHAHDHATERLAFETFVDLVHERLERFPDLHVYHYAHYEITALRRLMGRYGTREAELDDLLRRGVFVDLYKVVRNGVRASRPGYGLKELEVFLDFRRQAEIQDGGTSIVVFEQWMQTRDPALLAQIDEYNREDCVATRLLRDWLLERRGGGARAVRAVPAAGAGGAEAGPARKEARAALRDGAARRGRGAGRTAPRLPRPGAQARLVGVLRPDRDDAGRARRGRGLARAADRGRRAGQGRPLARLHALLPGAGAQDRRGSEHDRPGDAALAGRAARGRPRGAPARAQARPELRGRAAAGVARPRPSVRHEGPGGRARAARPVAAGARPPLSRARVDPAPRAVRPAGADVGPRRDEGARALARRAPPRHPGAAGVGEDVDERPTDRRAARAREAGGRRLDEPQGDPQPARRGRGGGCRGRRVVLAG